MPKDYFKIIPAVYLVLIKDNQILMLKRINTGYQDGNYGLIAGHLNGGESLRQAMVREAKEEADITVKPDNLQLIHAVNRRGNDYERIDFFFQTSVWQGEPQITEPEKCAELKWFPRDQLPTNIVPEVKVALDGIKNNEIYSEINFN